MRDQEFQRLATLYLENAIDETDRQLLNRELAGSPDRVRQFNDLRLLLGLIHEQGRSAVEPERVVEFTSLKSTRPMHRLRMSAAAMVMMGVFVGCLGMGTLWAFSGWNSQIPLPIVNGGFEAELSDSDFGYPVAPGIWTGDRAEVVDSGHQGVTSYEGKRMLRFKQTWGDVPGLMHHRANHWQIVDLRELDLGEDPAVVTLRARFNRIAAGPDTDTHSRAEVHAFEGDPSTAEAQLDAREYLASSILRGQIDSDVNTWEDVEVSTNVQAKADFLLIGIGVFEDAYNDPPDRLEFAGHYADGIELTVTRPGHVARSPFD